jgi:hypothetical protein
MCRGRRPRGSDALAATERGWEQTGRWDTVDILYKLSSHQRGEFDLTLGPRTKRSSRRWSRTSCSYRDSGVGCFSCRPSFVTSRAPNRAFCAAANSDMKDMYSFHATKQDLDAYYQEVSCAYERSTLAAASGTDAVDYASDGASPSTRTSSRPSPVRRDVIYRVPGAKDRINKEISMTRGAGRAVPTINRAGNAARRSSKPSKSANICQARLALHVRHRRDVQDASGTVKPIVMGCYGSGQAGDGHDRGVFSDEKGLVGGRSGSFQVHLWSQVTRTSEEQAKCDRVYETHDGQRG